MLVFALNGPPGAGKDTLAAELVKRGGGRVALTQCKRATLRMAAESDEVSPEVKAIIAEAWDPATPHAFKDTPHPGLPNNATPRQVFIDFCNATRQRLGPDCFVVHTIQHIQQLTQGVVDPIVVITDLGFANELDALDRAFPEDLYVVHIERKGCSFDHDIRTHLPFKRSFTIVNDSTPEALYDALRAGYFKKIAGALMDAMKVRGINTLTLCFDDDL